MTLPPSSSPAGSQVQCQRVGQRSSRPSKQQKGFQLSLSATVSSHANIHSHALVSHGVYEPMANRPKASLPLQKQNQIMQRLKNLECDLGEENFGGTWLLRRGSLFKRRGGGGGRRTGLSLQAAIRDFLLCASHLLHPLRSPAAHEVARSQCQLANPLLQSTEKGSQRVCRLQGRPVGGTKKAYRIMFDPTSQAHTSLARPVLQAF